MNIAPDQNRYAPPTAHVDDLPVGGLVLGGRGTRLGAAMIDGLLQGALFFGLAYTVLPALMPIASGGGLIRTFASQLLAGFILFALLQGYLLVTRGQTIGKMLLGLRIVRTDGSRAAPARLFGLRYFLGWMIAIIPVVGALFAIVDGLMIFRDSRKCLHDNFADTIVVKA